ncbi:MAG: glycosyl hydrolase family 28 protein [Bacteroidota bacterium]
MRRMVTMLVLTVCFNVLLLNANAQYDVKEFGAKGDGVALDTRSIQNAINQAHENGGGVVEISAGIYKIGTLILKDNINLHLQSGAMLLGSPDYRDYTEIIHEFDSRTNGLYAKYFMVFAEEATNISITGRGTIFGNGVENFQEIRPQNLRPFMIRLVNCQNITIRDVHLLESANWTLHLLGCKEVNIDGIVIKTTGKGNRDGLDIDACQRVTVANSSINTTDDAIVMKASCDILCQDIAITNCLLRSPTASAIKTGTESNGGFKNITVSNCVIRDIEVHAGIELMTVDGGIMQNIVLENLTMENVATPIYIRLGIRSRPYKQGQYVSKIDDVKDIYLNNISVINAKFPSSIMGLHHKKIKNISVNNYSVRYSEIQEAIPYNKVPFEEFSYPMASVFQNLPAYGFYCRNVQELHLANVNVYSAENETRPALTFDRVTGLELFSVKAEVKDRSTPMVHFRNTKNIVAAYCRSMGMTNTLFEMEDNSCSDLYFSNNVLQTGQKESGTVEALPDEQSFYDFETDMGYSVDKGEKIKGLLAHDLRNMALNVNLEMPKNKSLHLRLLILNDSPKPEKVLLKYDGIVQEFLVNWNEWGWAPITLLNEYDTHRRVDFEIAAGEQDSNLKIAKVNLAYQDIVFTD